ncbi:uncharacterized protein LOC117174095 isoform X2 [Belonocnema kinseyi]|uniref:uncharacterized protein LOC117174095 isoform X2 n=1 Tax=Belonocnema kinseyi TaxID=2817044 RepID=UPI00143D10CD|nr:uncharacterized protein LOC117174095 isoform X2 [Belonocnema kinseyi]
MDSETHCPFCGVLSIQNDPTRSKSSQENMVFSASAFSGPKRTYGALEHEASLSLQRTLPALQLESSKSASDYDRKEPLYIEKTFNAHEPIDVLTSSKNINQIDGNNLEVKPGEYYSILVSNESDIMSGEELRASQNEDLLSEPEILTGIRYQRVQNLQAIDRQARLEIPRIYSDHAPPPVLQTVGSGQRQANPDIQDIITGIVKLLNGKVNVAVNTVKPIRPTRINNRGPPRISDMAPLPPDFDNLAMSSPPQLDRLDHPYPVETSLTSSSSSSNKMPPDFPVRPIITGVSPSESIVSQERPWQQTYNRHSNNHRPIPPYKPLPTELLYHKRRPEDNPDKPLDLQVQESMSEHNSGKKVDHEENKSENPKKSEKSSQKNESFIKLKDFQNENETEFRINGEITTKKYQSSVQIDKTQNSLSLNNSQLISVPNKSSYGIDPDTILPKPVIPLESGSSAVLESEGTSQSDNCKDSDVFPSITTETTSETVFKTTLNIETSSSVQLIENAHTLTNVHSTAASAEKNNKHLTASTLLLDLDPSKAVEEDVEIKSSFSTPTVGLTSFVRTTESSLKTYTHPVHSTSPTFTYPKTPVGADHYHPRPGIVLDDTVDYKGTHRPFGPSRYAQNHETFDVVVSAVQGPGGSSGDPVKIPINVGGNTDVILTSALEGQGFVSIDGKRTYLNLFETADQSVGPTKTQFQSIRTQAPPVLGSGSAASPRPSVPVKRPNFHRRPTQPPVRIDTCIVGDSSTCDASQHEACATVHGVSACHCKPGFARLQHSLPCKKIISIVLSIRVDKIYDTKVVWNRELTNKESEAYQVLAYEANKAIESAMSMTPFSDEYVVSSIINIYQGDVSQGQGGVFVNATLQLVHEPRTTKASLAAELQRHLLGVIHRRNNNIGNSALYVESPAGSISNLQDLDECTSSELNDCHSSAVCTNTWGSFACSCNSGYKDPHKKDPGDAGRICLSCPSTHCNNRGTCSYQADQAQCLCTGNYYGAQCEVDGEVLGVAIGASVAALIIIVLTLVCLVMWSRRWSREQKALGSPVYGYIQGGIPGTLATALAQVGSVGTLAPVKPGPPTNLPPYLWGHISAVTDHVTSANLYAAEPMGPTRPSSAVFGYPTLSVHGTLPPVPLPRLQAPPRSRHRHYPEPDSSDSELQDKDRADLIPQHNGFHVPRPKSRSSVANQSGIYYDVEYDQGDANHLSKNHIPMSTYSMARPYYRT